MSRTKKITQENVTICSRDVREAAMGAPRLLLLPRRFTLRHVKAFATPLVAMPKEPDQYQTIREYQTASWPLVGVTPADLSISEIIEVNAFRNIPICRVVLCLPHGSLCRRCHVGVWVRLLQPLCVRPLPAREASRQRGNGGVQSSLPNRAE